jgi:hypothetical protein
VARTMKGRTASLAGSVLAGHDVLWRSEGNMTCASL